MPAVSPNVAPAVSTSAFEVPAIDDIAFSLVAALHRHPHLSNVLTHISRSSWPRIEHTLRVILDPATQHRDLTPLARNMLDLMVAERGDTGRIFKPYFSALLTALAGPNKTATVLSRIHRLASPEAAVVIALPKTRTGVPIMPDTANSEICANERILNLPEIDQRHRHTVIFQLFEHLPPDRSLQLVSDHDPRLLHAQLELKHGGCCRWTYLEPGPDTWRIRLQRGQPMS